MADIYAVIADPTRRDLLSLLLERRDAASPAAAAGAGSRGSGGDISVGEIVSALGLSQPTVSKHLRVLREAGLVQVREVGQHRYYAVVDEPLRPILRWLEPFVASVPEAAVPALQTDAPSVRTSPVPVPAPLRRAAENLPAATDVGASLGRTVAGARNRILDPVKKRIGHREQG